MLDNEHARNMPVPALQGDSTLQTWIMRIDHPCISEVSCNLCASLISKIALPLRCPRVKIQCILFDSMGIVCGFFPQASLV